MTKLYRILGKRGRITIPYEIRKRVGFSYNDILSFAEQDDRTVIVRREKLCNDCRKAPGTPPRLPPGGTRPGQRSGGSAPPRGGCGRGYPPPGPVHRPV